MRASAADCKAHDALIDLPERAPDALLADKGYDAEAIRARLAERDIEAVIPVGQTAAGKSNMVGRSESSAIASSACSVSSRSTAPRRPNRINWPTASLEWSKSQPPDTGSICPRRLKRDEEQAAQLFRCITLNSAAGLSDNSIHTLPSMAALATNF
ncbi:MAG TPA: hypothetical protein DHB48_15005 [Sphingobium sp.]|nr:hypothetical protein [Sphingobium sp.]